MSLDPVRSRSQPRARVTLAVLPAIAAALLAGCGGSDDDFLSQVRHFEEGGGEEEGKAAGHSHLEPLDAPTWTEGRAAAHMRAGDPIVGILAGGKAYALPWWILKNHHVANLTLEGTPVCVTLCERCSSAASFDPVVDGRRLRLRVVGIYDGTHVCRDDETSTYWTPFLGEGMHGPLAGRKLRRLRSDQASWADWLELHPDTLVAVADESEREGHGSEDSPGAKGLGRNMRASIRHRDERLAENELVLGVVVGGAARAYPIPTLDGSGAWLMDELGGKPIVILHKPGTWLAAAFSRELDGTRLDFETGADGAVVDVGTKSVWNAAGVARAGPLAGKELEPVQYGLEEWYIWATQHPGTAVHGVR